MAINGAIDLGNTTASGYKMSQPIKYVPIGGFAKQMGGEKSQERAKEYLDWQAGGELKVPEFAYTMHAATRGMTDEDRMTYLQSFRDKMANRLQRYEWRKARGVGLSKEQESVYKELLSKVQTINRLMETPEVFTKYMEGPGALIGEKLGVDYGEPVMGRFTPYRRTEGSSLTNYRTPATKKIRYIPSPNTDESIIKGLSYAGNKMG